MSASSVSTITSQHTITVTDGQLTIVGESPLSQAETEKVLEVLLIWKYGLEVISPGDEGE